MWLNSIQKYKTWSQLSPSAEAHHSDTALAFSFTPNETQQSLIHSPDSSQDAAHFRAFIMLESQLMKTVKHTLSEKAQAKIGIIFWVAAATLTPIKLQQLPCLFQNNSFQKVDLGQTKGRQLQQHIFCSANITSLREFQVLVFALPTVPLAGWINLQPTAWVSQNLLAIDPVWLLTSWT